MWRTRHCRVADLPLQLAICGFGLEGGRQNDGRLSCFQNAFGNFHCLHFGKRTKDGRLIVFNLSMQQCNNYLRKISPRTKA